MSEKKKELLPHGTTRGLVIAGAVSVVLAGIALANRNGAPRAAVLPPADAGRLAPVPFCASGLEHVPGEGCYAASTKPAPRPLLVYLHGLHTDATMGEELERQARVARIATAKGFDVLALRGRLGVCERLPEDYCWPSNERVADRGPSTVAAWEPALAAARARGGGGPRYLLGFSNGGYFAALVATRALVAFDAIAVAHGGPVEPTQARGAKPPMLLLMAEDDAAYGEMMRLATGLAREKWPHASVAREGGHALTESDVTNAVTFFARASAEGAGAIAARLAGHAPRPVAELARADAGEPRAATHATPEAPEEHDAGSAHAVPVVAHEEPDDAGAP